MAIINVPADYAAVNLAVTASSNGDTIKVAAGTYATNSLSFGGKAISIEGAGIGLSILDAGGSGRVMSVGSGETSTSVISGFTIKGGNELHGAGVYINGSSATWKFCEITENKTPYGDARGAGIYIYSADGSHTPTFEDCIISNNVCNAASYGGGGAYNQNGKPNFIRCTFSGNSCPNPGQGGGAYYFYNEPYTEDCVFKNNTSSRGAAVTVYKQLSPKFVRCVFKDNVATSAHAGVYCVGDLIYPEFIDCLVTGNVSNDDGSGITHQGSSGTLTITNCTITGNTSNSAGGGVHTTDAAVTTTITDSIIWGNTAPWNGGAGADIKNGAGTMNLFYSNYGVQYAATVGAGTISTDPFFADSANKDFHLQSYSPCIGTGKLGEDMGCYQFQAVFRPDEPRYKAVLYSHLLRHNFQIMDFNMRGGRERFNSTSGVTIELPAFPSFATDLDHPSTNVNYSVSVTPDSPASISTVGDIKVTVLNATSFTVTNSGANATDYFTWTTAYNNYIV